ncbi:uncharacterized protein LOC116248372 [Nymphaea colorata]|uniref:Late embryogenesis abundant protein LEA-2 subgroup domain-containing protein n=1 Tax=Nymphaea colorata TaxID=210225 RepID=A0A5K1ALR8_9MAGN|nr:uncharacterized protein LOC116248372 [Nymphaea colorata]
MSTPDQMRPLSGRTNQASSDEESGSPPGLGRQKSQRRRRALIIAATVIVLLAVVITTLALTVFKARDPELTTKSLTFSGIQFGFPGGVMNLTATTVVSVKNPNYVSFVYDKSTTSISYNGTVIGEALAPAGSAPARRTIQLSVTVNVMTDRIMGNVGLLAAAALMNSPLHMSSETSVEGRIRLGLIRKHVRVRMNCDFDVAALDQQVRNMECKRNVKF